MLCWPGLPIWCGCCWPTTRLETGLHGLQFPDLAKGYARLDGQPFRRPFSERADSRPQGPGGRQGHLLNHIASAKEARHENATHAPPGPAGPPSRPRHRLRVHRRGRRRPPAPRADLGHHRREDRRAHRPHPHRPDLHQPRRLGGRGDLRVHPSGRSHHHRPGALDRRQADPGTHPREGGGAPDLRRHRAPARRPGPDRTGEPEPVSPEHLSLSGKRQPPRRVRVHATARSPQRPSRLHLSAGAGDRTGPADGAVRAEGKCEKPAPLRGDDLRASPAHRRRSPG